MFLSTIYHAGGMLSLDCGFKLAQELYFLWKSCTP